MTVTLDHIQRFPIKGLSPEPLASVTLTPGEGMPGDRLFGFARYNSGFDPDNPQPLPKDRFVVLLKEAALAGLHSSFDQTTGVLDMGGTRFEMFDASDRTRAERWLHDTLALDDPEPPRFVSAAPHRFTDVSVTSAQMMNAISVLNLASVRDLADRIGAPIHPTRFRANLVMDFADPWIELDAVDRTITLGDVTLRILQRTRRCAATEVNPDTAERDLRVPYLLRKEMGHLDMGVYAEVTHGGILRPGDSGHLHG